MGVLFIFNSIGLGIGLAMDAFSVCIANGLKEPHMRRSRHIKMAGIYAFFQFAMPMIGWFCVREIAKQFRTFQRFIPWIALILLCLIGGQMIIEGIKKQKRKVIDDKLEETLEEYDKKEDQGRISTLTLLVQGVATSIDALSVGFTIASYGAAKALASALIIAGVTFLICFGGVKLGKIFGEKLEKYANYLGGSILIAIGLEIFITSL